MRNGPRGAIERRIHLGHAVGFSESESHGPIGPPIRTLSRDASHFARTISLQKESRDQICRIAKNILRRKPASDHIPIFPFHRTWRGVRTCVGCGAAVRMLMDSNIHQLIPDTRATFLYGQVTSIHPSTFCTTLESVGPCQYKTTFTSPRHVDRMLY